MGKLLVVVAGLLLCGLGRTAARAQDQEGAQDGPVLLHDGFESTAISAGTVFSKPDKFTAVQGGAAGGQFIGPVALGEGKAGRGALFTGVAQVLYAPAEGNIDPAGGSLDFWVQLHFDPAESNEKTRTVLRNQSFLNIWDTSKAYTNLGIYNAGRETYAVCLMNAQRNIVFYKGFQMAWKPEQWHHLKLTWGREIALWCDDKKLASGEFTGLFGPVPFDLKTTRLFLGTHIGYADLESQFTLDELTIRGPTADQLTRRPRITLPLLEGSPRLDGKLDDPFWQQACRVQGFTRFTTDDLAARQPALYAAYTAEGVYLAVQAPLPPGSSPRAVLTQRDSALDTEDAAEFFFQPKGMAAGDSLQFMVNAAGTQFDASHHGDKPDLGYNPQWQCAAAGQPGHWGTEAFLPFAALGLTGPPAAGEVWRGNLRVDSAEGFSHAATWAATARNVRDPRYFGELAFSGKARTVRQESCGGFDAGEPLVTFNLVGDFQPIITVTGDISDASGAHVFRSSPRLRDTKSIELRPPALTTGKYLFTMEGVDENGQVAFYQGLRFQTTKAFDVTVSKYPLAGYALLSANTKGVHDPVAKVACQVIGADGKPAGQAVIPVDKDGQGSAKFPIADLPAGVYEVTANVLGADGQTLQTTKRKFELFAKPAWWGNNLGLDHSVPPPHEPVKADGQALSVWGRRHTFAGAAFPRQIRNQNVDMFAAAPTIRLQAGGASADLVAIPAAQQETLPDAVTLAGRQSAGGIEIAARTTLEFDGFLRCDLTLAPAAAGTQVDQLTLDIPLAVGIGQFLLTSNGGSSNIQEIKQEVASGFLPYVWLGNDDMGLAWCADSDRWWSNDPRRAIVISPEPGGTVLKINFVSKPIKLDGPAVYSFGLMASPVRPIPVNDPFAYPSYDASGNITFSEYLTYVTPAGLKNGSGTLEFFVKRSESGSAGNTSLLRIGSAKGGGVCAYLLTPGMPDDLVLLGGPDRQQTLLKAKVPLATDRFTHLALVWNEQAVNCYVDGRLAGAGNAAAVAVLREALKPEDSRIRLGCENEYSGYTGLVLDELRISKTARYQGDSFTPPIGVFAPDAETLVVDHFEDTFQPDGQDAWTVGGGVPSIGSTFVDGKFGRGLKLQVAPARPGLDVIKEAGIKVCTHWGYQDEMVSCYGQPVLFADDKLVPGLKESLTEWKKRGIPIVPYLAYPAISSTSGLIERYGDEWQVQPLSVQQWSFPNSPPNYHFVVCCQQARGYQDYFSGGVVWAMRDVGFDGFYSDGLTNISACQNEAHGCGYRDAAGHLHPTYPFFAARETLKRMYRTTKAINPQGVVINHCSFNLMTPILSFSDVVYTGEHEDYENLLTARLRFSSKPWGLYVVLLGSSEHTYSSLHAMTPLLSGTSVFGSGMVGRNDFGRKDAAIRAAYRAFSTTDAQWLPWWQAELGPCRSEDPKVKVSFYYHPGQNVLLLAGNFNDRNKTPSIKLDLGKCGLAGRTLRARNVLTGQDVPITAGGQLAPLIRSKSFVLLRIE